MCEATLSVGWLAVQRQQSFIENTVRITPVAQAAEDTLTDAIDALASGDAPAADFDCGFYSRRLNRVRRNRRRERLLADHVDSVIRPEREDDRSDPAVAAEMSELLHLVKQKLDGRQFGLLMRLAEGVTYAQMSMEFGLPEPALRARVCRLRGKMASFAA